MQTEHTNEELAILIQDGHTELYLELWQNVEAFTQQQAMRFHRAAKNIIGVVDVEDCMQEAIFALYGAVKAFDRNRGYKFLTYYGKHLLNAFAKCCGLRTVRDKKDPIQMHFSIDAPITNSTDGDPFTLSDFLPDNKAGADFESAINSVWNEELREAIMGALELLPKNEKTAVSGRYLENRPVGELAEAIGVSAERACAIGRSGVERMRRQSRRTGLYDFWYEESAYNFTSLGHFKRTGKSSQETLLEIRERMDSAQRPRAAAME